MGPSSTTDNPNGFFPSINSYDGKVMLAAIISLLIVIFFVLLLHFYMRWYLRQAQQRRISQSASTLYIFDNPAQLHYHVHSRTSTTNDSSPPDGLDASMIASLPLFVFRSDEFKSALDCVICLTGFEDDEKGRLLPKCNHSFHVECIDMWLHSHSRCPICRTSVKPDKSKESIHVIAEEGSQDPVSGDSHNINITSNPSEVVSIQTGTNPNLEIAVFKDPSLLSPSCSPSSSSSSPSSSLGCSLKRMLSRSRSEH